MKYCTNYGHKINDNQSFCNNCGTKLNDSQTNQQIITIKLPKIEK